MDIDEFLDKEVVDIENNTNDDSAYIETSISNEPAPEKQDNISSFEDLKEHLGKGDLEKAEQAYFQMWQALIQQKLKWNKETYDNLTTSSRQFSGMLSKAYSEAKRKSENIQSLIGKARLSLREGKKDVSFKVYSEISRIESSIPNVFFEEKQRVWEQMMEFYKELKTVTDNELVKRVSGLIAEINISVDRLNMAMSSKDTKEAAKQYTKCIELYSQIPEGFLMYKNSIGMKLLDAYKLLSIQSEISNLQVQLNIPQMQRPQYSETRQPHAIINSQFADSRQFEKLASAEKTQPMQQMQKKESTIQKSNDARNPDIEETLQKLKSYSQE
ncbi:MAG TPA: hypothetical protein VJI97_00180 [Candidatus Nanoarchaeia archaeon]|nr:hypothetical protein [Candidatus Nanoarchaeia archaeon]